MREVVGDGNQCKVKDHFLVYLFTFECHHKIDFSLGDGGNGHFFALEMFELFFNANDVI